MIVYEMRTYTLHVGKMAEAVKLYTEFGYPALQKGGQDKKLIGYFQADTGTINQLVHLWKFDDDADRRAHWASVFANKDFVEGFACRDQIEAGEHAQHEELALGEVDDAHDAEDEPEADAHQTVDGTDRDARGNRVQHVLDEDFQVHRACACLPFAGPGEVAPWVPSRTPRL